MRGDKGNSALILMIIITVGCALVEPSSASPQGGGASDSAAHSVWALNWTAVGAIATFFYAVVTVALTFVAWWQLRALASSANLQQRSMCAQTTLALLHEWNHDLWRVRNDAHAHISDLTTLAEKEPMPLTRLWKDHPYAVQMSHFFDKVGYMVEAGYVDKGLVTAAFKSSAKYWWGVLAPFIREEAEKIRPDKKYQDYFKRLADP